MSEPVVVCKEVGSLTLNGWQVQATQENYDRRVRIVYKLGGDAYHCEEFTPMEAVQLANHLLTCASHHLGLK